RCSPAMPIARGAIFSRPYSTIHATSRRASRSRCSRKRWPRTRPRPFAGVRRSNSSLPRRLAMTNVSAGIDRDLPPTLAEAAPLLSIGAAHAVAARAGLVWTLVRTDFKARYHGSLGGFVWALLKPLSMFVVLMAVFSFLFASNPNYKLDLIVGLFLWDFFAEATKTGLVSLHAKGFLLTKARFPSWILVVTSISNAVITLGVFGVIITLFLAGAGRAPGASALLWFFMYCVALIVIVAGFSLATSVLFLR